MTYRKILQSAISKLEKSGIEEASNDAWLLMEHAFMINRTFYLMHGDEEALEETTNRFKAYVDRRCNREPLQYITGTAPFMGLEFNVSPEVLIPRFDTEVLVDRALMLAKKSRSILDMCTGSGCIAVTMAYNLPKCHVTAADLSKEALNVAKTNKDKYNLSNLELVESDMFANITDRYDMIISNPPYIRTCDIEELTHEVKACEPIMALDGYEDGLFFYRILASESANYLNEGGILIMEIGFDQAADVSRLLMENDYADVKVIKDLAGLDRVVCGWRK